jgi:hypothetical protein
VDVKLPQLRVPVKTGALLRHLSLVYLVLLAVLLIETAYIMTRDVDQDARARAEAEYPSKTVQFNKASLESLDALQSAPGIPAASGKSNPFVP